MWALARDCRVTRQNYFFCKTKEESIGTIWSVDDQIFRDLVDLENLEIVVALGLRVSLEILGAVLSRADDFFAEPEQ